MAARSGSHFFILWKKDADNEIETRTYLRSDVEWSTDNPQ